MGKREKKNVSGNIIAIRVFQEGNFTFLKEREKKKTASRKHTGLPF